MYIDVLHSHPPKTLVAAKFGCRDNCSVSLVFSDVTATFSGSIAVVARDSWTVTASFAGDVAVGLSWTSCFGCLDISLVSPGFPDATAPSSSGVAVAACDSWTVAGSFARFVAVILGRTACVL